MNKLYILGFLLLMSACALSPQVVKVDPTLSTGNLSTFTDTSPFYVRVIDHRNTNVLGKRGGTYEETAIISSDEETVQRVQEKLNKAFADAGYEIDENTANQLIVSIENLSYTAIGGERVSEVEISAEINATAATQAGTFSKKYKASHTKSVLKAPDNDKNAELINNVFGAVVQRLLEDKELLQYLRN